MSASGTDADTTASSDVDSDDDGGDDGVDSAEIDEAGEDTADGTDKPDQEDGKTDGRSTVGRGRGGGGGGREGGGDQGQGGTDPYSDFPGVGTGHAGSAGRAAAENRHHDHGPSENNVGDESHGGSSEERTSGSLDDDAPNFRPNSIRPKDNKSPFSTPRKPQLSEPLMSLTAELEARLNSIINRLNPDALWQRPHQRSADIKAAPHQHLSHLAETPLAPRPIFEPLEILSPGADNSAHAKEAATHFRSKGAVVRQRSPVISHGGPLVGPEDFSSLFMEKLDAAADGGNNEQATGLISNFMQMEKSPPGETEVQTEDPRTTSPLPFQSGLTNPSAVQPTSTSSDFDHMIATLLQDLSDHLIEQRTYHDKQTKTNTMIDKAVIELSKLTWILKPVERNSTEVPTYERHMTAHHIMNGRDSKAADKKFAAFTDSQSGQEETISKNKDVMADQMLSTRSPKIRDDFTHQINSQAVAKTSEQVPEQASTLDIKPTESSKTEITTATNKEDISNETFFGLWNWLRFFENSTNLHTDLSLDMLIDLLSDLTSKEHGMTESLATFGEKGQRLIKEKPETRIFDPAVRQTPDGKEVEDEEETFVPNGTSIESDEYEDVDDNEDEDEDEDFNNEEDMTEDDDFQSTMETEQNEQTSDQLTFPSEKNQTSRDSNRERIGSDDDGDDSHEVGESDQLDNDSDATNSAGSNEPTNSNVDKVDQNTESMIENPSDMGSANFKQGQLDEINQMKDLDYLVEIIHKDIGGDELNYNHKKDDREIIYNLSEGQAEDSDEYEGSDSNDDETDYSELAQKTIPGSILYGGQMETQKPIAGSSKLTHSRRKRQSDMFWQQFLGQSLNPVGQQGFPLSNQGTSFGHESVLSNTGIPSQGLVQNQGLLAQGTPLGQGVFNHGLGQQQQQQQQQQPRNGFQQTPNQQNHIGAPTGQGPLAYPIPPFRSYPLYSRYNNYLGFNHPHFGYPGYPGMNHEPGEYPSFETGPSADVMEEVINNLFQRYWENVRNMLRRKGPTTTPEYEYEGPVTTTTTTTASPTTKAGTVTTTTIPPTTLPPLNILTTTTASLPAKAIETTINTTSIPSNNKTQNVTSDPIILKDTLAGSTPAKPLVKNLEKATNKNTALPSNFFRRRPLTRTTSFPLI